MTAIETRYSVGDVVYGLRLITARRRPTCPLCEGKGRVALAAVPERLATCPDCHGRLYDQDDSHMAEQQRATVYRLTVGEVRWSSAAGATYMAEETGIGTGQLWPEDRLHPTADEALAACSDAVVVFGYLTPGSTATGAQTVIRGQEYVDGWEPW